MPIFNYEATDKDGGIVSGEIKAQDKKSAIADLGKRKLIPIKVDERGAPRFGSGLSVSLFDSVKPIDRIVLVRNIAVTIKAGLNMLEALDILITDATKDSMRKILTRARINLENGQPLSKTFESYKKSFPPVFIGMFKAGEASGQLDEILKELSITLTREYNLSKKIKGALAYPIILLVGAILVVSLLMLFVLPRLVQTFQSTGVELPLVTEIMMKISGFVTANPLIDIIGLGVVVWFFTFFRKTETGHRFFTKVLIKTPVIRDLVKKIALVRFTRILGNLLSSGTPIVEALELSAESVGNPYYKKAILDSSDKIKRGIPFWKTFDSYKDLFPNLLISMIRVGEKTGSLENILETFADFYEDEVDSSLKQLTIFLEPLLLLFIGIMIGVIAISILLPIYQLVGNF